MQSLSGRKRTSDYAFPDDPPPYHFGQEGGVREELSVSQPRRRATRESLAESRGGKQRASLGWSGHIETNGSPSDVLTAPDSGVRTPTSPPPEYRYEPLEAGEIRLFRFPRSRSGQTSSIKIELCTYGLQKVPAFTALSYCWGDPGTRERISVNGKSMYVSRNVGEMLRHMSSRDQYF